MWSGRTTKIWNISVQPNGLNSRQARWALFFNRFSFSLSYRPGSKNIKPDALSRQFQPDESPAHPEGILPPSWVIGAVTWEVEDQVKRSHAKHPAPSAWPDNRLFVPASLRSQVLPVGSFFPSGMSSWCESHFGSATGNASGGVPWGRTPRSSSLLVRSAANIRARTKLPQVYFAFCQFLVVPGPTSHWISSLAFHPPIVTRSSSQ